MLLVFEYANDKSLHDVECCLRVRIWELLGSIDELIATKEELGNVSAHVVHKIKLATWVQQLIAFQVEHKVVKDDERPS